MHDLQLEAMGRDFGMFVRCRNLLYGDELLCLLMQVVERGM